MNRELQKYTTMKKNILRIALVALVGALMAACTPVEPTFNEANLIGLWQENGTEAFVRFTTDNADGGYQYGREWDEADDVTEGDLTPYGSGWFKWQLVKSDLTEIHFMENGGADIPKIYTVTKLTETELQYRDDYKKTHSFSKVVER